MTDIVDQAKVGVGLLPSLEKRLVTFKMRQPTENLTKLRLTVKYAGK